MIIINENIPLIIKKNVQPSERTTLEWKQDELMGKTRVKPSTAKNRYFHPLQKLSLFLTLFSLLFLSLLSLLFLTFCQPPLNLSLLFLFLLSFRIPGSQPLFLILRWPL